MLHLKINKAFKIALCSFLFTDLKTRSQLIENNHIKKINLILDKCIKNKEKTNKAYGQSYLISQ